jgi:hypothetical protein
VPDAFVNRQGARIGQRTIGGVHEITFDRTVAVVGDEQERAVRGDRQRAGLTAGLPL